MMASQTPPPPDHDLLTGQALAPAIPAATVVIFRDGVSGEPPQLLMVERTSQMVFAAGAAVFPGGRIDADDHVMADRLGATDDRDDMAARVAAIRETLEETGLGIGFALPPPSDELEAARARLHDGIAFSQICGEAGWDLHPELLTPFTRWRPPFNERRIFDTRFYLARDHGRNHVVQVDRTENRHLFWSSAAEVLERADRNELKVIFPTRCNLHRLAQFASFDAAVAHARAFPARMVVPFIEERDGASHLCIPDDLGYPVTSEPLDRAKRG